ncbi:MAG: tyrosine--tRNA ligase [Terasakiella sp.]|uniref:tyrosine--tRNA ligase n=1 Tax=unclassified Terasakiella TaxID=2614952 RepID=UPI003B00D241
MTTLSTLNQHTPNFLRVLQDRGFIHQCSDTDTLAETLSKQVTPAYIGFDATADSLHVGHLMSIMTLRWLQKCGHKPIVLIGGGTTRIGDPSFRDTTRPILDDAQISANIAGIKKVFSKYLTFGDGPSDAVLVNNADWLDDLKYLSVLRDIGPHFTVNKMLSFDSVKSRLDREQPLTFLEFNYMILQAFDFVELSKRFGCVLQMGGSDQWGNIVNGIELGRRINGQNLFGLTTKLLTTSSGTKMGKTASGAVWLNEDRLSPWDFWQFWRNTEDDDVLRFLRLFTEIPLSEINEMASLKGAEINEAKKRLANEVTALCHGTEAAQQMEETARQTFEAGQTGQALPRLIITNERLKTGIRINDLLHEIGFCQSKSEGRRLIKNGGVRINDHRVTDEVKELTTNDFNKDNQIKITVGRKSHGLFIKET